MTAATDKIPLVGILGGIGSGKSTVARLFAKLGCAVIDADALAHEILETPDVRDILAHKFGDTIFSPDGRISRKALAGIVFADPEKIAFLNSVIHPRALGRTLEAIDAIRKKGAAKAIILDAPLLVEAGWHDRCDILVFVECNQDNRLAHLRQRTGFNRQQLEQREKFQISLDKKAQLAYHILNNNSDLSALESQVGCVFSKISGVE
jgi:dephospho-CoA kinase